MTHKNRLLSFSLCLLVHTITLTTTYWDWQSITTHNTTFPAQFMWGATSLSYEVEGYSKASTWYTWENQVNAQGQPFTHSRSGKSIAHAEHYKNDIQLIKNAGLTSYCFSLDWSSIEPEEGYFNEKLLNCYKTFCKELVDNNITPIVTLKDLCDPLWFGYLGGFEHERNNKYFIRYSLKVYEYLGDTVTHFITFWSPESYAMMGYLMGMIPPGISSAQRAATVLKNEFEAHVQVYKEIKAASANRDTQIGIVKHMHILEPWHVWDRISCSVAHAFMNTSFYNFFTTGTFSLKIPLPGKAGVWVKHTNAYAPKSVDFIGINYYGHGYIKNIVNHVNNPSEIPTDVNGMTIYPEGLYYSIKEVSDNLATKLNIPMIITQNGIATTDESIRDLYIKRHLYALSKAIADGYNVIGYCYYSLLDSFSWGSFDKKFGLFAVDKTTLERKQKSGSRYFFDVVKRSR